MLRGLAATLGVWAVGAGFLRVVVVPPEICPPVTAEEARGAALESADWLVRAQNPDGTFVYEYDVEANAVLPGYNEVRHAGVTMSLYQAAAAGYLEYVEAADRALERMLGNLIAHDDWVALQDPGTGEVKLGSSGLMLVGLAHRRLATGETEFDEVMRELGRFIVAMQEDDGALLGFWDAAAEAPVPDAYSRYYTGEAFWGLALLHRIFPEEGWDDPARAVADYLALHRDEEEDIDYQPWADQWAAYGLAEVAAWPGGSAVNLADHHIDYARSLAERFGFLVRVDSRRTGSAFSDRIRGEQSRAAGMGTWGEGLDSLWRIASADPRMADLQAPISERATCTAGMLADRQVTSGEAQEFDDPDLARGAWFRDGVTRMDDQQHGLSALLLAGDLLRTPD